MIRWHQHHARETYKELREEDEQWGNLHLEWRALSAPLKDSMYNKMEKKCESIFAGSTVPQETIRRGMEQRVHQVRRSWIDAQKLRSCKIRFSVMNPCIHHPFFVDSWLIGIPIAQETPVPAARQPSRSSFYDPVRDP